MSTTVQTYKPIVASKPLIKPRLPRTLEEFSHWNPKDGYKYEWVDGKLLKSPKMDQSQLHIVTNLTRCFMKTKAFIDGDVFYPEIKSPTDPSRMRVPDMAYFTLTEQKNMGKGKFSIPKFVVEILSPSNTAIEMDIKLDEYFRNGVQLVWHIFPETEKIYVFNSAESVSICRGNALCSAEAVIEGFQIIAKDVFKKL